MFNFCSLYSGSSGNCFFVETDKTKILVDCGESSKKIIDALKSINVDILDIDAILITHEHIDHVKSLGALSSKYDIPVFANKETFYAMPKQLEKIAEKNICFFENSKSFSVGDLHIVPFSTPHDAANPCGFNISHNDKKISIATDIGHMTSEIFQNLKNSSFVLLESNYEPEVLKCSKYPYFLKERISGPNGHLSNIVAGQTISKLMDSGLKTAMLGHLSKESNFPELAYKTVLDEIISNNPSSEISLSVATRHQPTPLINIV